MGISVAISIPAFVLLVLAAALRNIAPTLVLVPILHSAICGLIVAIFAHPLIDRTFIIAKSASGIFAWWSYALFYPYLLLTQAYVRIKRLRSLEPLYTEICDGLFVGAWPVSSNDLPCERPAVLDCTIELPRNTCVEDDLPYLCIPAWDTRSPHPDGIELAVRWAMEKRAQNYPVFIHCAKGHGRSVAVMCALLVALGVVSDWSEGEALIKRHRPGIRLNSAHRRNLQEWQRRHRS